MGFKIKANPTFPATVKIRAPGGEVQELGVVFRHKRKDDVLSFFAEASEKERSDIDCILDVVESWDADEPLSKESVADLMQNYAGSAAAIFQTYMQELITARLGN
jgi:hypothetical protein